MSQRKPLIAGNWKMNHGGAAGCELAGNVARASKSVSDVEIVVAPPFTALAAVAAELSGSSVELAAQDMFPKSSGAYTGAISAPMLLEAGCRWVIIGHSERRQHFGESDAMVAEKVAAAIEAGLRPIACVGETLEEREGYQTLDVVYRQVDAFSQALLQKPGFGVIAYEPVWAIGTGRVAGPEQAQEVHGAIRSRLSRSDAGLASGTRILYGGSVKADNAEGLLRCVDVDGALVGGASLDADGFMKIVEAAAKR
ncbi:MAG TPA: triose-phosphate isomerase [Polyangiaceae bacterium]